MTCQLAKGHKVVAGVATERWRLAGWPGGVSPGVPPRPGKRQHSLVTSAARRQRSNTVCACNVLRGDSRPVSRYSNRLSPHSRDLSRYSSSVSRYSSSMSRYSHPPSRYSCSVSPDSQRLSRYSHVLSPYSSFLSRDSPFPESVLKFRESVLMFFEYGLMFLSRYSNSVRREEALEGRNRAISEENGSKAAIDLGLSVRNERAARG
jgi:hypothetical protein